jgi:hypothetical protein
MDASGPERRGARLRAHWRWLALAAILVLLWALAGFLLVPRIARHAISDYVQRDLGRRVAIGRISFNPFTLTAEVRDFALAEPGGAPIASFGLLRVNAELLGSLLHRAWTLEELRLEKPVVNVLVDEQGRLNLARLAPPAKPQAPAPRPGGLPAVRIGALSVVGGSVTYLDRSRARPFGATLAPIEFSLSDFRTAPSYENAYRFEASTAAGEQLAWSGRFTVQPLGSDGHFSIAALKAATIAAYLQDALPLALVGGRIDLAGDYRLRIDGALGLDVTLPAIAVRELAIAPKQGADATPWISIPALDLSGTTLALAQRRVHVERLSVANATLTAWREPDGTLNLSRLAPSPAPLPAVATAVATAVAEPAATAPAARWDVGIATIEIKAATLDVEDRRLEPAGHMKITPIDATISGYALASAAPLGVAASIGFDGHGRFTARGQLASEPLAAELDLGLEDFELAPLQPWIGSVTAVRLEGGSASARGHLRLLAAPRRGESRLRFQGDVGVARLRTRDAALGQELLGWQQLDARGIDLRQAPDSLAIDTLRARQPYGRVVIGADRTLNIARVLAGPAGRQLPGPDAAIPAVAIPAAAPAAAAPAVQAARTRLPMRIRRVLIEDGKADFADFSVQPNFAAGIVGLAGSVAGLSSDPDSRATVQLEGSVDRHAPVDINGEVNLLAADAYSDIALSFRNMELTTFNPYSGKFAGYSIAKGKLTTELKYHVEHRRLEAQHHIVLDQLEFGAATASKDAVPLPVKLAVALLKDRNGVIDINLPVSGSLDDPQFRIGPIVWKAVLGLMRRIVTAPFALLGSLFGGGADLQYVQFAAGSAELAPAERDKLGKLVKALAERPQLQLDVPLQTLSAADDTALADAAFEAAVAPVPAGKGRPAANLRFAALKILYRQAFGAMPEFPRSETGAATAGSPAQSGAALPDAVAQQIGWLESQLKPKYTATPEQRAQLARARANAVQQAVLAGGQVPPERVFLTERASGVGGDAGGVRMELKLE